MESPEPSNQVSSLHMEEQVSPVDQELLLLIIKYLENGPCKEAAEKLTQIVEQKKLLPRRYDWEGETHDQTLQQVAANHPKVDANFLPKICQRLVPLLDKELKPNYPGLKSLLSGGSQCLLRTEKSLARTQFTGLDYCARRFGTCLVPPNSVRVHNTVKVLRGREYSGPVPRSLIVSPLKYSNIRQYYINLGHLSAVYCVLFDKLGEVIVTGADDLLIKLWSAKDGRLLASLRGSSGEISDIAIDNRNILLAAGTVDKLIRIWSLQTLAPVGVLVGHQGIITGVNFCPLEVNGYNYLASISTDGCIGFWKYKLDREVSKTVFHQPVMFNERIRPGNANILCSSFSPGGLFLATGSGDHNVRVYKMDGQDSPISILEAEEHTDKVDSIQWAHQHLRFLSGSRDGTALIWYYKCNQWRSIRLDMNTTLLNVKGNLEENNKKMKVTMVAWDRSDRWVITAQSITFQLKIWDAFNGNLIQVLKGHSQEVYVLEPHPLDSRVLLSAGHDGMIIVWDILSGKNRGLKQFHNTVEGQGEGALFDGKWSPDGTMCAVTDSYGHLLVYGLGGFKRPSNIPRELFFHTDYRSLSRPNGFFEPTFDEVTNTLPHLMPPAFLVDQNGTPYPPEVQRLVPGREDEDDALLVPDIITNEDGQVEVVEENEGQNVDRPPEGQRHFNDHGHVYIQTSHIPVFNNSRSQTSGESRVTESSNTHDFPQTKEDGKPYFVKPLPRNQLNIVVEKINAFAKIESDEFKSESKKSTDLCDSTNLPVVIRKERKRKARQPRQQTEFMNMEEEDPNNLSISASDDSESDSDNSQIAVSDLDESSSSSDGTSSSDYSDWIHNEGVNLEPPKRLRRHSKINPVAISTIQNEDLPDEVPDIYKPSEWLAEVYPKKAPYYPQMGDEVMFFKYGYQKYVDAVRSKGIYELNRLRSSPWGNLMLQEPEMVKVVGIKYEIAPPRICCLKLAVMKPNGKLTNDFFNIKYHDMADVIDFFVLRQIYETAMSREWNVGDRFRSMIDNAWWWGTIEAKPSATKSPFLGYKILWDNNERENLSPWDLEPLKPGKDPPEQGGSVPVEPEEFQELLYHPRPDEWPQGDRDATCEKIITGVEEVMGLSVAEPFLVPVDISQYPTYAYVVEYPVDLTTLRARFQNRFYRRITSAQFDVRYLAANAEKFNEPHSNIVKYARIITELLLKIIRDPNPVDVPVVYHELAQSYQTSESEEDEKEAPNKRRTRSTTVTRSQRGALHQKKLKKTFNWRIECREVLEQLWACPDSEPFRKPVDKLEHPDYDKKIIAPMDLGTIREELRGDNYESPLDFVKDVKRIFHNSRNYNQNKRSKIYTMTTRLSDFAEDFLKQLTMQWNSVKSKRERKSEKKERRARRRRRRIKRVLVESDDEAVNSRKLGKGSYENDGDFNPSGRPKLAKAAEEDESDDGLAQRRRRSSHRSNSNSQNNDDFECQPSTSRQAYDEPSTSRGKRKKYSSGGEEVTPKSSKRLKVMYPRPCRRKVQEHEDDQVTSQQDEEETNVKEPDEDDGTDDEDYTPKSQPKRKPKRKVSRFRSRGKRSRRRVKPSSTARRSSKRARPKQSESEYYSGTLSEENSSSHSPSDSNIDSENGDEDWSASGRGRASNMLKRPKRARRVGTRAGRHYREHPSDGSDGDEVDQGYYTTRSRQPNVVPSEIPAPTRRRRKKVESEEEQEDEEQEESSVEDEENSESNDNDSDQSESEEEDELPQRRSNRFSNPRARSAPSQRPQQVQTRPKRNLRKKEVDPLALSGSGSEGNSSNEEQEEAGTSQSGRPRRSKNKNSYAVHSSSTQSESDEGLSSRRQESVSRRGRLRKPTAKLRGDD